MFEKIRQDIESYTPFNEQEEKDKALILKMLDFDDIFTRENTMGHMTASAWVVNSDFTKILMAYHNIYDSWSWLGGHADGNEDLLSVAIREVREEGGIKNVHPVTEDIFSLESLTVDGHIKRGQYVSSHLHFNITYLLMADESETVHIKKDENSDVSWFGIDEAVGKSSEKWFRERIYSKLNEKLKSQFIKQQ